MKTFLLVVFVSFLTNTVFSQTVQKLRKVVPVMSEQSFYLNGGARAYFGGKSRSFYKIDLPKNTVEWYYIFSTSPGEGPNKPTLNLVSQLTRAFDPTGITALAASAIMAPTGSNSCDIYLMDRQNADAFMDKADLNGGTYSYSISGSRENYKSGTIQIRDAVNGSCYLGFKNPSTTTGINIFFEVAAIVEEEVVNSDGWPSNSSNNNSGGSGSISNKDRTPDQEKAVSYGNLGWRAYENGDVDKCIDYSKKALKLDNTLGWVKSNLGLCYLIKGEESIATDYYIEALSDIKAMSSSTTVKKYLQATIDDIDNALKEQPVLKGSKDIKDLFAGELKSYR